MIASEYETECRARGPLPDLATRLGVSLSTLYRRFKGEVKLTPEIKLAIRSIPKSRAKKSSRNAEPCHFTRER